jgi:hypothetical protein
LLRGQVDVALADHQIDHAGKAEFQAVVRREDPRDPARVQQVDLIAHDDPATAAVHADVARPAFPKQVHEVREVLDVPALVRADGDTLDVLRDGSGHHLVDRPVVPEVHDLGPLRLQDSPHDVDRRVVPVEQARGSHEPNRVHGSMKFGGHASKILGLPTF